MKVRVPFVLKSLLICLFFTFNIVLLTHSMSHAEQVVITPDNVNSPTFQTSTATCIGANANTHINLGFILSVTGKAGSDSGYCTIGGGSYNAANGEYSTVGGGTYNIASDNYSTIGGGELNTASATHSTIGGGELNTASVGGSTVAGGTGNSASGSSSTVGGGANNTASGYYSTVVGGTSNTASGNWSTVGGGDANMTAGDYSWAGGAFMKLTETADQTFVWGFSNQPEYISTANAFLIFPVGTSGKVGIGTVNPGYKLEVNGDAAKSSGGTAWSVSSDLRLKDVTGEYERGLDAITNLRPITFHYKKNNPRDLPSREENVGFVAQEVKQVFPEAISEGPDGYLDFNMHSVNVAMVNAIRELKAENDSLKAENDSLKRDIQKIKKILGI